MSPRRLGPRGGSTERVAAATRFANTSGMPPPVEAPCGACNGDLPPGARFCPTCGAETSPATCPSCGAHLTATARFCPACGLPVGAAGADGPAPAAPVSERRVTSVLFGDLVGFTSLSESLDPEDVRDLLSRYFEVCRTVIGRYGGTVEKFIGDAVMAVWGVPIAHEDDAERAVRAGLELVRVVAGIGDDVGAPGLTLRVGVVTGEVAATLGATGQGMVAGDAVNTAARVQSIAEPGQVWTDDTTRSLSAAAIAYEDCGDHPLKGKTEPVRLFVARAVVAQVGGGQRVDGLEAPIIGRDRELRLLKELFHATDESRRPLLVTVDGAPGIGKSRLAWEFEKYADGLSASVRWHRGRCPSYGEGIAFWALAEAVRSRLGLVETDAGDTVGEHLDAGLATWVPDPEEREWLRPRLATLIGLGSAGTFPRDELFSAWTTFFERVGGDGDPVVLVIDDAHHADDGLLDFVDHLLRAARAGVFVLALARPDLLARRQDLGGRRATVIRLDALEDTAMSALIDGLVVGLPVAARAALAARADGVPLYAVETVRSLIDRDLIVPRDGRFVLADGATFDLDQIGAPASLQALVAARLDALSAAERRVVADASVLGTSFTRDALAAVTSARAGGADPSGLDATLSSLQRKEILAIQVDRFSAEFGQYRFVQGVVRQVAYATQAKRDRKARHLAAADYLSAQPDEGGELAVLIAQHLLDAVDASPAGADDTVALTARAGDMLVRAAGRARALGAPREAQRLYETALARATDPADHARLHVSSAECAREAGNYQQAAAHATEAIAAFDSLGRPLDAGYAAGILGMTLTSLQDNARAIEVALPRWRELDGVPGSQSALLRLTSALGAAYSYRGDLDAAARFTERRLVLAEALADPEAIAHSQLNLGAHYGGLGATLTSRVMYESAAQIARQHGLPARLAMALNNLVTSLVGRDLPAALAAGQESVEAARRSGSGSSIDFATANFLGALWIAGRLEGMGRILPEARENVVDPAMRIMLAVLDTWLADATGAGLPPLPERESTDSVNDLAWLAYLDCLHARAGGDLDRAARLGEQALDYQTSASGLDDDYLHIWPSVVTVALEAGDVALAERLVEPVAAGSPAVVTPILRAQLLRLRGLIGAARDDDPALVEADLRAGADALDAFGAVGLRAVAQEELATWLIGHGRGDEGRDLLTQARATYREIGATGWLDRSMDPAAGRA